MDHSEPSTVLIEIDSSKHTVDVLQKWMIITQYEGLATTACFILNQGCSSDLNT